jgi:Carboxypeptidase regulatory-like domain
VKTDANGRFTLGIREGAIAALTARRAGFGPAMQTVRVGAEPQRITLTLSQPRRLAGRVVNGAGRPIVGATLSLDSWRGSQALEQNITTDADGRFVWEDAPSEEVRVQVYGDGYLRTTVSVVAGAPNSIVLESRTTVKGTVVDAQTGERIPRFTLVHGTVWNPGESLIWQPNRRADEEAAKASGSFEWTFIERVHQLAVRVAAEGYLPAESGLFAQDVPMREFTFRLKKAEPIRGTVLDPDGSAAREAIVYLVPAGDALEVRNGEVPEHWRREKIHTKVSPGGAFAVPPQNDGWLLVALSDAGFASIHQRDLLKGNAVRLEPWAQVAGIIRLGTKPAFLVELQLEGEDTNAPADEKAHMIFHQYEFVTDPNGRFRLPRVFPGHYDVVRVVPNGVSRIMPVKLGTMDVTAGRSYDLNIGGSGRPVVGRVAISGNVRWMVRSATVEAKVASGGKPRQYGIQVDADGRFRAENIGPGEYTLRIGIHEPPPDYTCGWGRLIGDFQREFTVKEIAGGVSDDPLELGELEAVPAVVHP